MGIWREGTEWKGGSLNFCKTLAGASLSQETGSLTAGLITFMLFSSFPLSFCNEHCSIPS